MTNQYIEALEAAEHVLARKEEFKYQLKEYERRFGAYESDVEEYKLSGKATSAGFEALERRHKELLDEQEFLKEMEAEINADITRYQEMRAGVEA